MCFAKIKKWFCNCPEPEVIVKTEVKIVKEVEKMPNHLDTKDFTVNKKIADYLKSLTMTIDEYSQNMPIHNIEIKRDSGFIVVDSYNVYFDGSLYS